MMGVVVLLAAAATNCGDKPNQTAMTMCQKAVADQADAEMNRAWTPLYAKMKLRDRDEPDYAAALLAAQRAWLAFRDAECRIESYEWRGGSMQPFTANQCRAAVTRTRTRQLVEMSGWN